MYYTKNKAEYKDGKALWTYLIKLGLFWLTKLDTCKTKSPTIGIRLIFESIIPKSAKTMESPIVAPSPQEIPPIKLLTIMWFIFLCTLSCGCIYLLLSRLKIMSINLRRYTQLYLYLYFDKMIMVWAHSSVG